MPIRQVGSPGQLNVIDNGTMISGYLRLYQQIHPSINADVLWLVRGCIDLGYLVEAFSRLVCLKFLG